MEKNQYLIFVIFVLVIGLVGGYMIAQHTGHAAHSHIEMHETRGDHHDHSYTEAVETPHTEGAEIQVQ